MELASGETDIPRIAEREVRGPTRFSRLRTYPATRASSRCRLGIPKNATFDRYVGRPPRHRMRRKEQGLRGGSCPLRVGRVPAYSRKLCDGPCLRPQEHQREVPSCTREARPCPLRLGLQAIARVAEATQPMPQSQSGGLGLVLSGMGARPSWPAALRRASPRSGQLDAAGSILTHSWRSGRFTARPSIGWFASSEIPSNCRIVGKRSTLRMRVNGSAPDRRPGQLNAIGIRWIAFW